MTMPRDMQEPVFILFAALPEADRPGIGVSALAKAVEMAGGTVVAGGDAAHNAYLEPGTPPKSVLISLWPAQTDADEVWGRIKNAPDLADLNDALIVLAGTCLAETGLPDLPTPENTAKTQSAGPAAYMLIEGSMSNPEAMGRYRDIIFPMIREGAAYYLIYAASTAVKVLNGVWSEQALIVSHWPDYQAAQDFWYCDRYQNLAIPTRAGAGRFSVTLLPVQH